MTSQSISSPEPAASFSLDEFAEALKQHDYHFERGQVVRGKVAEHASEGAYIDIGGKSAGFVPTGEISAKPGVNLAECLPLASEMDFLIVREQNAEGQVTLSRRLLEIKQAWDKIAELAANDKSVQLRVTRTNKGGVIGEVEGLRGFIPRSHLIEKDDMESLVGQALTANFLEVDRERNRLILSQRQFARAAAISQLEKGSLKQGKIVKIQPYGVFVDLDGVTGLLHITQISNVRVEALPELFQLGQSLPVFVLDIDEFKNRVSLSTKVLENYAGEILENLEAVIATAEVRADKARIDLAEGKEPKADQAKKSKSDEIPEAPALEVAEAKQSKPAKIPEVPALEVVEITQSKSAEIPEVPALEVAEVEPSPAIETVEAEELE
jgi:small subunit ribosomal protein S1